jgi:xanthine dehydrogenase accessory factor
VRVAEFWQQVLVELEGGHLVYICLVVDQKKGSPGTTGARMVITGSGQQFGTIGGGIMERRIIDDAQKRLQQGEVLSPRLCVLNHRKGAELGASGLICGGAQTNLEAVLGVDHVALVREIVSAAENGEAAGVCFDENGIRLEADVDSQVADTHLFCQNQDGWHYRMNLKNRRRIVIYGGGHCGVALAQLMCRLDYAVTLVEPRKDLPTVDTLPDSIHRIACEFDQAATLVSAPSDTIAIVMTYSMVTDIEALKGALPVSFKQIGLMGSPIKIAHIRESLKAHGFDSLQIQGIRAPIGLEFNSDTPEEIAVSIAAQILLERKSN